MKLKLESVLCNMKSGLYNYTKDGRCSGCGNCCSALLPVTRKEVKLIKRYVKAHCIRVEKNGNEADLSCPFRDGKEKRCTVYAVRPQICRVFRCDRLEKDPGAGKGEFNPDAGYQLMNIREVFA